MTIIDQLKTNEKPFGLMSEEMQEKAREIGWASFWVYTEFGQMKMELPPVWGKHPKRFEWDHAFRLRPDYEDEPEIVECEIVEYEILDGEHGRMAKTGDGLIPIHEAFSQPDCIGFKFEDGMVAPVSIYYRDAGGGAYCKAATGLEELTVLHATHVLFRRRK